MPNGDSYRFSGPVTVFREMRLPESAAPAGYAALIDAFGLMVPLPRTLSAIGLKHRILERDGWRIFTPRHAPEASVAGHLTFALKYEGIDLAVLKHLFRETGPEPIESMVRTTPSGSYARRIWYLYEWLTGRSLDLPNAVQGSYVPVVNEDLQWACPGRPVSRQRVKANLPGTPAFCPLVRCTPHLREMVEMELREKALEAVADLPDDVLSRAAAFLLLEDSKTSFAIEGEHAPQNRIQRWGRAIGDAGKHPLDLPELLRLQRIVIGDSRFVKLGLRQGGGFVGRHDRDTGMPLPSHISARPEDLDSLISGMIAFASDYAGALDPVMAAAVLAFGFVFVHPFEDGNGRLHRYLIHHILAQRGFNPPGVVFPVSAAILRNIVRYHGVLEDYSQRLLPTIDWEPADTGNVTVRNDTADFYRYFDCTLQAEFLYDCVHQTIVTDLPAETAYLRRYDEFERAVQGIVDMPDRIVEMLFSFLRQNRGSLSGRARRHEFAELTAEEISRIERHYQALFGTTGLK